MRFCAGRRIAYLRLVVLVLLAALPLAGSKGAWGVSSALAVRLTPARLLVTTDTSRSPVELLKAAAMFDRDMTTEYRPVSRQQVLVELPQAAPIAYLKVYGNASYTVRLWSVTDDELQPRLILDAYDLRSVGSSWLRIPIPDRVTTTKVLMELTPASSSNVRGVAEFELWSESDAARDTADGRDLLNRIAQGAPPFEVTLYTGVSEGSPQSTFSQAGASGTAAVPSSGGTEGATSGDSAAQDGAWLVDIPEDPRTFKRAYLVYNLNCSAHWAGLGRSVNGHAAMDGALAAPSIAWRLQVEEISPESLLTGANRVAFVLPDGLDALSCISDVGLLVERDNGRNFVTAASVGSAADPLPLLHDGEVTDSWAPYELPGSNSRFASLAFDRTTQLDGVALYVSGVFRGDVDVQIESAGQFSPSVGGVRGSSLTPGWNYVRIVSTARADAARIQFARGEGSTGRIHEIRPIGSGVGKPWTPGLLRVVYPDAGQFSGREAYIRGFVLPRDNGSGPPEVKVSGQAATLRDGAFESLVDKDTFGFFNDNDDAAWSVEVVATYPDRQVLRKTVRLDSQSGAPVSVKGRLLPPRQFQVSPGQARQLLYDESRLELGANALRSPATITMSALDEGKLATLDQGMTNVTRGPRRGYRFFPHNQRFAESVRVSIPYDPGQIPPGLTEQDIQTFYFDDQRGAWVALDRVAVDAASRTVVSLTDHFTDMINATLTTPDHPQADMLDPTRLKDIAAADPGQGVNLIAAPEPNEAGEARLSYNLELPPGRREMHPSLAIAYGSGAANGWLGLGWDLSAPAVSIETRWGVPRYDAALETESYMLAGAPLAPVAHRAAPVARTAEKVFHTRTEGEFKEIVRHGSTPASFWWEVKDKLGVRSFYGGAPSTGGADPAATLTDAQGRIFKWFLKETRDLDGNAVVYGYEKVTDPGILGGTVPGYQLYLESINYTRSNGAPGPYTVTFIRDAEQPGYVRRPDVSIDARGGFKMVTSQLLKRVELAYNGALIRAYDLEYRTGAFQKTLLSSITQRGEDGSVFNTHRFDYFDEVQESGSYHGFGPSETWSTGNDDVRLVAVDEVAGAFGFDNGKASALNGYASNHAGGHLYVGFNPDAPTKQGSGGGKVGFTGTTSSEDLLTLFDVNGDSLPDKVFKSDDDIYFRPNGSGPHGTTTFGAARAIGTLSTISEETTSTVSFGEEVYLAANVFHNDSSSFTSANSYFNDTNGDGLPDQVNDGRVLFNHLDANGIPTFDPDSQTSPVPVGPGSVDGNGLLPDFDGTLDAMVDNAPLQDTVRRWIAPFSGQIRITGDVSLLPVPAATAADGVRVAIQHNGTELWSESIAADDASAKTPAGVDAISVARGDRIYFRVGSVFEGSHDQVSWDPEIAYLGVSATTDVNLLNVFRFRSSEDFVLAGRQGINVKVPFNGTVRLTGVLQKTGATTDDVRLLVIKQGAVLSSQLLSWDQTGALDPGRDIVVDQNDTIQLRVQVDSPIDLAKIQWAPSLFYISTRQPAYTIDGRTFNVTRITDAQGNHIIQLHPPYDIDFYPDNGLTAPQAAFVVPIDRNGVTVATHLTADGDPEADGIVTFTVKRAGALLAKRYLAVVDGVVANTQLDLDLHAGDRLFFDFSSYDPALKPHLLSRQVTIDFHVPLLFTIQGTLHSAVPQGLFPQSYRGWAPVGYEGNGDRGTNPIHESDLDVDFDSSSSYDPRTASAFLFTPFPEEAAWHGPEAETFQKATILASSRLGTNSVPVPGAGGFAGRRAVSRLSVGNQAANGGGVSYLSGSLSSGHGNSELDYVDMNGDKFPDVIGNGRIQYSTPVGGLEGLNRLVAGFGNPRRSEDSAQNVGIGGSPASVTFNSGGDIETPGQGAARESDTGSQMATFGLSGGLGSGSSSVSKDLIDINGDDLPDRITVNGSTTLMVAFNLGYAFAPPEPWGTGVINEGSSQNISLGTDLGFNGGIYDFAGGLSLDTNSSTTDRSLLDINGDGLLDRVTSVSGGIRVGFNTGSSFLADTDWIGAPSGPFAKSSNTSLGEGGYFTVGVGPLCLFGCYVILNPGIDAGQAINRQEVSLIDVDGDGNVDHVRSTTDASMQVARNRTGRTNLLRSVARPLGARIDLQYERDGNTYAAPHSRFVLSKVTTYDGVPGDGVDSQVTSFRYENGVYDRLERDFYGYGRVIEEDRDAAHGEALYRSTVREYRTDSYYTKGLLARELSRDALDRPFVEMENTYRLVDVATGLPVVDPLSTTATVFPQHVRSDQRFYEGQAAPQMTTYKEHEYDANGNLTRLFDAGEAGPQDDLEVRIAFSACAAQHVVGAPVAFEAKGNGILMRRREGQVDCPTGHLTKLAIYRENGVQEVTDLEYSANGNLTAVIGPPNATGQRYRFDYAYDPDVETHIARVADSFGFTSLATYNPKYGHKTSTTDANANVMSFTYDIFGRQTSVTGPYEQGAASPTIEFAYHPEAAVPWAFTRHNDKFRSPTDTIDVVRFIDGLKRELQLKTDAAVATSPGASTDVRIVSGRVTFDLVGRIIERYYPTTEPLGDPGLFQTGYDSIPPTRSIYDVLDRTTRITIPDGAIGTYRYGFGPDRSGTTRFETIETDANGKEVRVYRNVREEVAAIKEVNTLSGSLQPIWTTYAHDPLHQLVAVIDDQGNRTNVAYDNVGRRLSIDSPDAGKTEFVYDRASNLTAKITSSLKAAGQQIAYDYDFNRLRAIRYPAFPQNNVTYTYGPPGASNNRAGRIVTATDESGREERLYGKLGEVTQETKTVATDTGGAPLTYVTQYLYDTFGRMQRLVYPDGEAMTYLYDSGGRPRQVFGDKTGSHYEYVRSLQYDKFEQRAFLELGNSTRTSYTYRPDTRRLQEIRSTQSNGSTFQKLAYTYDPVGNVLALDNDVAVPPASQYGGPTHQRFYYDDLYQLTSADGRYQFAPNKTNRYTLSLAYDTLRNVRSKSQSHEIVEPSGVATTQHKTTYDFIYAYGSPRPHAATHVGERTYTFDADGNQTGWTNDQNGTRRLIVWDEENRIQSVFDNGHEKSYKYDYRGTRVIKRGPQGETAYVNQWFTIRNRTIGTKHVFVGPTRVASKLMKPPGVDAAAPTPLEKDRYFYHPDHVGSTGFVTDADGRLFEHLEYFPFGETWVEESSNTQRTPYLFTAKELDEETGLYAFGARYYDARLSQWTTNDPALDEYLAEEPAREGTDRDAAQIGPGAYFRLSSRLRGVYAPANLGLYGYAWQNPIVVHDPDGRKIVFAPGSSEKFKKEYARALKYLSKTKDYAIIQRLQKSKETITLVEGTKLTDTAYRPYSKELVWNPYSALIVPGGGKQSPALGLLHELDHAEEHLKDPAKYSKGDYDKEELRVIKGSETRAARQLGEGTRTKSDTDVHHLHEVEHSDMR